MEPEYCVRGELLSRQLGDSDPLGNEYWLEGLCRCGDLTVPLLFEDEPTTAAKTWVLDGVLWDIPWEVDWATGLFDAWAIPGEVECAMGIWDGGGTGMLQVTGNTYCDWSPKFVFRAKFGAFWYG